MRIVCCVFRIGACMGAVCIALSALPQPQLSSQAYISLITCSPGKRLYEAFGHSAFRVYDPENEIDLTFNYGTFDFERPGFYSNYAKGRPIFMLSVSPTRHFINAYVQDNRSVFQDVLNLTREQNQRLFELLQENYAPQNRDYVYDYIYDNCSTRLRDMIVKLLGANVIFDSAHLTTSYSFRGLMDLYLMPQPWGDLAIDLALGSEIDAKASPYQYMFLPDFLQSAFQHAVVMKGDGAEPLVKHSTVIFKAGPENSPQSIFTPVRILWMVFFLFLIRTVIHLRQERISLLPDMMLFFITGMLGILIAYISFLSNHHASGNYNLLWALPTHALFALLLPFRKLKFVRFYFLATAILAIAVLAGGYSVLPQKIHYALIPLILSLAMRAAVIFAKS